MGKFKKLLINTFSYVGGLFSTHPVTFFTICAGTLTAFVYSFYLNDAFNMGWEKTAPYEAVLQRGLCVLLIFGLTAFCIESSPLKKKMPLYVSIPVYCIVALFSVALGSLADFAATSSNHILLAGICRSYMELLGGTRIMSLALGYCTIMLCLGIFFSYRKPENTTFSGYLANLFSKLFFANITFAVLEIGIAALTGIFTVLLWGDFIVIFSAAFMLLFGGYLLMRTIACFTEPMQEVNTFIAVLLRFVLHSISLAAYLIIYIYMIKILILQEFPSNSVFAILTALFVASMPVAYMCRSFPASPRFFSLSARLLPYIFAPFILLQIYTVGVRIRQYGLTPTRYFGLLFIAFEIVYIVLYAIFERTKEQKMSVILAVLAGCALISTWLPAVNALDLSKYMQLAEIRSYLAQADHLTGDPVKAASRAAAGYSYLASNNEDFLKAKLSEADRKTMQKLTKNEASGPDGEEPKKWYPWMPETNRFDLDITGYDHMQYAYLVSLGKNGKPADTAHAGLYLNMDGKIAGYVNAEDLEDSRTPVLETNLNGYVDIYKDLALQNNKGTLSDREYNAAMQQDQVILLDDGNAFCVTDANLCLDTYGDVQELFLQGYYLTTE
ncbi:MAG: DUF4153 domain-containing protein [Lachnospiraceae bacterium]|nr:DUF4153 domain-containing protein [Lachnospiraceae bacterium]